MTKSRSNLITMVLALLGCGIAILLTVEHYTKIDIGCTRTGEGCATTLNSDYGHVGPLPTALFGLGMYFAIVGICLVRGNLLKAARNREVEQAAAYAEAASVADMDTESADLEALARQQPPVTMSIPVAPSTSAAYTTASPGTVKLLDAGLWGLATLGLGISVWLQYIAIYQLHSFCKYCFTSAILVSCIFALSSWDYLVDGRKLSGEQKMLLAVSGFILAMGAFIVVPDIWAVATKRPTIDATPHLFSAREIVTDQLLHVKGDPKAPYMLIEFADYMCGHCAKAAPIMEQLLKDHAGNIRIAFRNFPLPIPAHHWSRNAACAAEAAGEQGKFWEMHDLIFSHQNDLESPDFKESTFDKWAEDLKLDTSRFQSERQSTEIRNRVDKDTRAAQKSEVMSTPSFFFVTPKFVVKFAGIDELNKYMADPKKWDTPPPPSKDARTMDNERR